MKNIPFKALIVLIIVTLIIATFHFYKYSQKTKNYEIIQQKLDNVRGNNLYLNLEPLIITFIENDTFKYNIDNYSLKTPITINEKYISVDNFDEKYMSHNSEICLIRPQKDTVITLINPKFIHFFNKSNKDSNFKYYHLEEDNYSQVHSIDIVLHEHNILCLPRFWLFNCNENSKIDIYLTHNIFTVFFKYIL